MVKKADVNQRWYSYANKEWANAVILKDETQVYATGAIIPEENIESYFVWIPKYSYQLWDSGEYDGNTEIDETKVHTIPIRFGLSNTSDAKDNGCTTPKVAGETGNCKIGDYMTHPAFLAFNSKGFWVGKFETGYDGATTTAQAQVNTTDSNKVVIKPNVYSWRNISVGNAFKTSYDYKRNLESHMMKNTEWGAVAYLSHSEYGKNNSVRVNNNGSYITGYASVKEPTVGYNVTSIEGNRYESTALNQDGTYTKKYNSEIGYTASTTGNVTGIYDMAGGAWEAVAGYADVATKIGGESNITTIYNDFFTNSDWNIYYDKYTASSYSNRILGDSMGEMGPFGTKVDPDQSTRTKSSWYGDYSGLYNSSNPWGIYGGMYNDGITAGIFGYYRHTGREIETASFRIVLAP